MKKLFILFILFIPFVSSYNSWFEFDEVENIEIYSSVYINGQICSDCSCNFTLTNPQDMETFIYFSSQMDNLGNGIYYLNLSENLKLNYSNSIYPITIVCNDSINYGSDTRDGLKVSRNMFNYTAGIIPYIFFSLLLVGSSFYIKSKKYSHLKTIYFFTGLVFAVIGIFASIFIFQSSPLSQSLGVLGYISYTIISILVISTLFFVFGEKLIEVVNGKREERKD